MFGGDCEGKQEGAAEEFWEGFGVEESIPIVTCDDVGSLASYVLNYYGLSCSESLGGSLDGLDIKRMDAMQVIKLSLLEESADTDIFYELGIDSNGDVEFIGVGENSWSETDVYYEIQSGEYKGECSGVMIQGYNPMPTRKAMGWRPIWCNDTLEIYETGKMYNNCATGAFNQYATIVYNDPHLTTALNDGIDNVYEITAENPWESLIGYATYVTWDGWEEDKDTSLNFSDSAKILIEIEIDKTGLGELQRRPRADPELTTNPSCFEGQGDELEEDIGIEVPLPEHFRFESVRETKVDKFNGIVGVYVVGRAIDDIRTSPTSNEVSGDPKMENATVWVDISRTYDEVFSLEQGKHFVVNYTGVESVGGEDGEEGGGNPKIVFADNSRLTDPITFPTGPEKLTFYIRPDCEYATDEEGNPRETDQAFILPTDSTQGILVKQILVAVELNTPSIVIYNPDGWKQKALKVAESLKYEVAPLIVEDKPAPIAFNGTILDQSDSLKDHDPTTKGQTFDDTELELAMDEMSAGGGISLTLSFLKDEDQVASLSESLWKYMSSDTGVITTYVCGPNANPRLGDSCQNGGVVNSISYSYQDSNSYTVSVNCGPKITEGQLTAIDGGPALKIVESVSAKGTIIQDLSNNVQFKVSVDGIGDRIAINMIPAVLRVGDKVSVSIHNNPVEA